MLHLQFRHLDGFLLLKLRFILLEFDQLVRELIVSMIGVLSPFFNLTVLDIARRICFLRVAP